jgi:hypothetical protein
MQGLHVTSGPELGVSEYDVEELLSPNSSAVRKAGLRDPLNFAELATATPPNRDWIVRNWIGCGYVTLLAGPAGSGKTAFCQMLCSAVSIGTSRFIEKVRQPAVSLLWAGEDDRDELWRRQLPIADYLCVSLTRFCGRLYLQLYSDVDMTLAAVVRNRLVPTPLLRELREQVGDYGARLVVLDSVARIFGGNENDRNQVTTFVSYLTEALAPTNAALVILGHPAKTRGSEYSGSGAWEASVRARLYFGYGPPEAESEKPDDHDETTRFLAKRKANYTDRDVCRVQWRDQCMQPVTDGDGHAATRSAEELAMEAGRVLRELRSRLPGDAEISANELTPYYLVKLARKEGLLGNLKPAELKIGLVEAIRKQSLAIVQQGKRANGSARFVLTEAARAAV